MDCSELLDNINSLDVKLTLWLNFDGGVFMDCVWTGFSSRLVWVPLGIVLLYIMIHKKTDWRIIGLVVLSLAATVLLCDQISAAIFKPYFMRLRPSHDPDINGLLHYVGNYRGGKYGFVSSHAANAFGVFTYLSLLIHRKTVTFAFLIFTLCVCYSRIYLGVHYLGDILSGSLLGICIGYFVFIITTFFNNLMGKEKYLFVAKTASVCIIPSVCMPLFLAAIN